MKDALTKALAGAGEGNDDSVDRILAAAFFRPRPLQAGSVATVVSLADRRAQPTSR
jgi:hypothetical protein